MLSHCRFLERWLIGCPWKFSRVASLNYFSYKMQYSLSPNNTVSTPLVKKFPLHLRWIIQASISLNWTIVGGGGPCLQTFSNFRWVRWNPFVPWQMHTHKWWSGTMVDSRPRKELHHWESFYYKQRRLPW